MALGLREIISAVNNTFASIFNTKEDKNQKGIAGGYVPLDNMGLIPKQYLLTGASISIQNGLNTYTGGTSSSPTINISGITLDNINVSGNSIFNGLYSSFLSGGTLYSGSTELSLILDNYITNSNISIQNGLNTYTGGTNYFPQINISGLTIDNINVSGISSIRGYIPLSGTGINNVSGNVIFNDNIYIGGENFVKFTPEVSEISGATGTINNPYMVNDYTGFQQIISYPNSYFYITSNIDCDNSTWAGVNNFSGSIIGNGFIVKNLNFDNSSPYLINTLSDTGIINDLCLSGCTITNTTPNLGSAFFCNSVTAGGSIERCSIIDSTIYDNQSNSNSNGGFVNDNLGFIKDCYSFITFHSNATFGHGQTAGGFISINHGTLINCYSVPSFIYDASPGWWFYAGFSLNTGVGNNSSNCYYDLTVTNSSSPDNHVSDALAMGLTTTQMQNASNFLNWDFVNTWNIDGITNGGRPFLLSPIKNDFYFSQTTNEIRYLKDFNKLNGLALVHVNYLNRTVNELSANTIYNIENAQTFIEDGLNTYTGGTNLRPTINISGLTLDNINVSGNSIFNSINSNILSGNTIYSGNTDLNVFFNNINYNLNNKFDKTGGTINGDLIVTGDLSIYGSATTLYTKSVYSEDNNILLNFSGNHLSAIGGGITVLSGQNNGNSSSFNIDSFGNWVSNVGINSIIISGNTFYSGSSELGSIFNTNITNAQTFVQNGLNIYTGGTTLRPTINVSSLTINTLSVSGNSLLNSISAVNFTANTISGGTLYSGLTELSSIFNTNIANAQTFIQNGLNIYTGGTTLRPTINVSSLTINTLSVSGISSLNSVYSTNFSSNTISGGTLYSGSTELGSIINSYILNTETFVEGGLNTYTGGTNLKPTINVSSLTINTLSASGNTNLNTLSANTISGGTLYSGFTDLSTYLINLQNEINTKANISGQTFTGNIIAPNLSASTISGDTLYSGSTELSSIFNTNIANAQTFIQNGLNTYTGGTNLKPTINVSSLTINTLSASGNSNLNTLSANTISGGTLYSGSTELGSIINSYILNTETFVEGGLNTYTGGTSTKPTINVSSLTINTLSASGNSQLNIVSAVNFTANTISGGTFYSGSTELSSIFNTNIANAQTFIQNGLNTYTGGTNLNPTINVSSLTINTISASGNSQLNIVSAVSFTANTISGGTLYSGLTDLSLYLINLQNGINTKANISGQTFTGGIISPNLSANTISGGTFYSGSTELSSIFNTNIANAQTFIQNGLNTYTGGTNLKPTINVSSLTINTLSASGNSLFNSASAVNLSANTISGGTLYSGSTELSSIFNTNIANAQTFIQNGLNTYTGGTNLKPTINVSSLTINTISASGNTNLNTLSANTISGGTLYSGSTDLSLYLINLQNEINTKANISGQTFTGNIISPSFSASTISGNTLYSGSTELSSIFNTNIANAQTFIQNGLNTYTGGTNLKPTINVSSLTINTFSASGNSSLNSVSAINFTANTISGGTFYSGSTELSSIFNTNIANAQTFIQNGLNTYTGGTNLKPTVNVSAATLDHIVVTANSTFNIVTATTISANTIYSGSTNVGTIITNFFNTVENDSIAYAIALGG